MSEMEIEFLDTLNVDAAKATADLLRSIPSSFGVVPLPGDALEVIPAMMSGDGKIVLPPVYVFVNRRIFKQNNILRFVVELAPQERSVSVGALREKLRNVVVENAHRTLTVEQSTDMLTNVVSGLLKGKILHA